MNWLLWVFGWPHEGLHVLALWLVGQRAVQITRQHVELPPDLPRAQYIFVAGLPALVFWPGWVLAVRQVFGGGGLGWLIVAVVLGIAAVGTLGDLYLIAMRLLADRWQPPDMDF